MKVSELCGVELDCLVARAEGLEPHLIDGQWKVAATGELRVIAQSKWVTVKRYSEVWDFCGPVIERERILLSPYKPNWWRAVHIPSGDENLDNVFCGELIQPKIAYEDKSPLIAAMRCYVASKFGAEASQPPEKE